MKEIALSNVVIKKSSNKHHQMFQMPSDLRFANQQSKPQKP